MTEPVRRVRGEVIDLPPNASGHDRNRLQIVRAGMQVIDPKDETFEERSDRMKEQRKSYASMHAHMEMAATVLAAGGTFKMAAHKAGVSVRQVKKYYTDNDFRKRIEELRNVMFSKARGSVIKEIEKRTRKGSIENIELLDLLRIFDRVAGPIGGKAGIQIAGDVNVNNNYDTLIAALSAPKSGDESTDFQEYRPEDLLLPGEDPPV